jgi:diaminopimelate epimerase
MKFTKLQALGNDFLVVASSEVPASADRAALAVRLCDRHFGAGADGVVFASPAPGVDVDVVSRIYNADGGEAEVSGNGTRCLAAWLDATGAWPVDRDELRIGTAAGTKRVRRAGQQGSQMLYEADMGSPRFVSAAIPMRLDPPAASVVDYPLDVAGSKLAITALSMGNPHCTVLVASLGDVDVSGLGAAIERHDAFPERVNVEFATVLAPDRLRVLFWERGVGATLSSGTGSCAAVVAASLSGRCNRAVDVETLAGVLRVVWDADDGRVRLTGPSELLYEARWLARA